jgi:dCMP deaminase
MTETRNCSRGHHEKPINGVCPTCKTIVEKGMLTMTNWDQRLYDLASFVAQWSKDPSTKVGAVLVGKERREIALGYNGFPPGIADTPERLTDRTMKYKLVQHAERNVLDNARFDVRGGTLYVTFFPCSECAKSIVSRGITRVVTPAPPSDCREPWATEIEWARLILTEAGVQLEEWS